jgi:ABC-type branched-subunit amino acid transport system ATPase component
MLSLSSVTKRYGSLTAFEGVSLDIRHGEFFGLLGPNGAGKSATMSLIAGLCAPNSGTLTLDGRLLNVGSASPASPWAWSRSTSPSTRNLMATKTSASSVRSMGSPARISARASMPHSKPCNSPITVAIP